VVCAEKRCPDIVKRLRDKIRAVRHFLPLVAWSGAMALEGERNRIWITVLRTIYMQKDQQEDMKYDISEGGRGQLGTQIPCNKGHCTVQVHTIFKRVRDGRNGKRETGRWRKV
jgi:hypothetical protein